MFAIRYNYGVVKNVLYSNLSLNISNRFDLELHSSFIILLICRPRLSEIVFSGLVVIVSYNIP